ncbi:MAG: DUF2796 domain-containing protein [Methyloprofundus sp.]|nr:DUF2796 domain-containing protein [Methyloprofundus sp.]
MLISDLKKIFGLTFFLASQAIYADTTQVQHISLNAHMHGLSELTLAMEGEKLEIQLKSPAMNLLGFEHKARTKNDIAAVENALSMLGNPDSLFLFSERHCSVTDTSVDISGVIDSERDPHEDEAETDDHEHQDRHSEIIASYHYRCESTATLFSITVNLFEIFPGIQQIRTLWITEKQQGGLTLNSEKRIINLKR